MQTKIEIDIAANRGTRINAHGRKLRIWSALLVAVVALGATSTSMAAVHPAAMCRPTSSADVAKWTSSNAGYKSNTNGAAMSCGFTGAEDTSTMSNGGNTVEVHYKASAIGQKLACSIWKIGTNNSILGGDAFTISATTTSADHQFLGVSLPAHFLQDATSSYVLFCTADAGMTIIDYDLM